MEVYLMITITSREKLPGFLEFYDKKLPVGFVLLGYGTAKDEILNMLGLARSEKAVCLNVVTDEVWKETKGHLRKKRRKSPERCRRAAMKHFPLPSAM